ncbi:MAG: ECF transporter S component [Armatimonadota bacterium]|nr:ECF transporter S component [Armatimonadota bacterium]
MTPRHITRVAAFAAAYVVLGQVVRFIPNPMVPGAIIALNMVVVVIAGLLFGPTVGGLVGLVGTVVNAISPAGNPFEWAAVVPHTVMGVTAGVVARRGLLLGALTIVVGHALNIAAFLLVGLLPLSQAALTIFSVGLLVEVVIDVVVIVAAVRALRLVLPAGSRPA